MKALFSSNKPKSLISSRVFRVLLYSTSAPEETKKEPTLYTRILGVGDPKIPVAPILNQWVEQGKSVKKDDLTFIMKKLKRSNRLKHALEVSQWMRDQSNFALSSSDITFALDLISRIHGVKQVESYFDTIPEQSRVFPVYQALLHSYARGRSMKKAEALMQKLRELGFARSSVMYNLLLTLYKKAGQPKKLHALLGEMEEKGIHPDKHTYNILLAAYAAVPNIDGIEKTLAIMEANPKVNADWASYASAANGYKKNAQIDRALQMLKKSEECITGRKRDVAYKFLLTMYASIGKKDEVYRMWHQYKSLEKVYKSGYVCMINSLLKFDDIAGAEKILEECISAGTSYDFQIPHLLITAYCNCGHVEKAEVMVKREIEEGKKPYVGTWEALATAYVEDGQVSKAVEAIKSAFLLRRQGWKPNRDTLAACLVYLKEQGDAEKAEEFVRLLGAPGHMSIDDCERLLDYIFICNQEAETGEVNEMEEEESDTSDDENMDKAAI